jgi:hypothetical protein
VSFQDAFMKREVLLVLDNVAACIAGRALLAPVH